MFEKFYERLSRAIAGYLGSYGAGDYSSYRAAMYVVENYPDLAANIVEMAISEMSVAKAAGGSNE